MTARCRQASQRLLSPVDWKPSLRRQAAMDFHRYSKRCLNMTSRRGRLSPSKFLLLWRRPRFRLGDLIRYLTLLPSFRVIERTLSFPSSVPKVCSAATRVASVVLFTVYLYNQMKERIIATVSNQAYWPTLVCLFTACRLCKSKKRR